MLHVALHLNENAINKPVMHYCFLFRFGGPPWAAVQIETHQSPRQPAGQHRSPPAVPAGPTRFKRGHSERV